MSLFFKACNQQSANACDSIGEAYEKGWGTPPSITEAARWYRKSCRMGLQPACRNAERAQAKAG